MIILSRLGLRLVGFQPSGGTILNMATFGLSFSTSFTKAKKPLANSARVGLKTGHVVSKLSGTSGSEGGAFAMLLVLAAFACLQLKNCYKVLHLQVSTQADYDDLPLRTYQGLAEIAHAFM